MSVQRTYPSKGESFVCDHCHRVVDGEIRPSALGNMIVPPPHTDGDGMQCDGVNAEVILVWGAAE